MFSHLLFSLQHVTKLWSTQKYCRLNARFIALTCLICEYVNVYLTFTYSHRGHTGGTGRNKWKGHQRGEGIGACVAVYVTPHCVFPIWRPSKGALSYFLHWKETEEQRRNIRQSTFTAFFNPTWWHQGASNTPQSPPAPSAPSALLSSLALLALEAPLAALARGEPRWGNVSARNQALDLCGFQVVCSHFFVQSLVFAARRVVFSAFLLKTLFPSKSFPNCCPSKLFSFFF